MVNRICGGLIFSVVIGMIAVSLCSGAEDEQKIEHETGSVSYTHLTLPTILLV